MRAILSPIRCLIWGIMILVGSDGLAVEKLKFGTPVKIQPIYYLLILAAEEDGLWQRHNLDVEWIAFRGGSDLYRAVAARSINTGATLALSFIEAAARGVPMVAVAPLRVGEGFHIWVRADSRFKKPLDLKGAKIGVSRLSSGTHAYGLAIANSLGLQKEVKFVGVGDVTSAAAALKTGVIDGGIYTLGQFIGLKLKGELRDLVSVDDYLPQEWVSNVIFARKEFAKNYSDLVMRVVLSLRQGISFVLDNPRWAIIKIMSQQGFSEEAARITYQQSLNYTRERKIDRKAIENVKNFLIQHGLVTKESMPPTEELYTEQFSH